jgi:hypothetical protein
LGELKPIGKATEEHFGRVLDWEKAAPPLDYDFFNDYGDEPCNPVLVDTKTKIAFVHAYDGTVEKCMKTIIAGSKSIESLETLAKAIEMSDMEITQAISGTTRDADSS